MFLVVIIRILISKCLNTRNGFLLCLGALWAEFSIKVKFQCHLFVIGICSLMNFLSYGVTANSWSMAISESVNHRGHLSGGHLFISPESQRLTSPSTRTLGTNGAQALSPLWHFDLNGHLWCSHMPSCCFRLVECLFPEVILIGNRVTAQKSLGGHSIKTAIVREGFWAIDGMMPWQALGAICPTTISRCLETTGGKGPAHTQTGPGSPDEPISEHSPQSISPFPPPAHPLFLSPVPTPLPTHLWEKQCLDFNPDPDFSGVRF